MSASWVQQASRKSPPPLILKNLFSLLIIKLRGNLVTSSLMFSNLTGKLGGDSRHQDGRGWWGSFGSVQSPQTQILPRNAVLAAACPSQSTTCGQVIILIDIQFDLGVRNRDKDENVPKTTSQKCRLPLLPSLQFPSMSPSPPSPRRLN